jgi:hypothetical protein
MFIHPFNIFFPLDKVSHEMNTYSQLWLFFNVHNIRCLIEVWSKHYFRQCIMMEFPALHIKSIFYLFSNPFSPIFLTNVPVFTIHKNKSFSFYFLGWGYINIFYKMPILQTESPVQKIHSASLTSILQTNVAIHHHHQP